MAPDLVYNNFGGVSYKARVCSLGKLLMEMGGERMNLDANQSFRARFDFHLGFTMIEV